MTTYTFLPTSAGLVIALVVALTRHPRSPMAVFAFSALSLIMSGAYLVIELTERTRPVNKHDVLALVQRKLLDIKPNSKTFFQAKLPVELERNQGGWTSQNNVFRIYRQLGVRPRVRLSVQPPADSPVLIVKDANGTYFALRFTGKNVEADNTQGMPGVAMFDVGDFGTQRFLTYW